eukprot:6183018-Pleurochrysis_carterae.AAC.1
MSESQQCFQITVARSMHYHKSLTNHLSDTFFENIAHHWEMSPEICASGKEKVQSSRASSQNENVSRTCIRPKGSPAFEHKL